MYSNKYGATNTPKSPAEMIMADEDEARKKAVAANNASNCGGDPAANIPAETVGRDGKKFRIGPGPTAGQVQKPRAGQEK